MQGWFGWRRDPIQLLRRRIEDAGTREEQKWEATSVLPELDARDALLAAQAAAINSQFQEEYDRRNGGPSTASGPFTLRSEYYLAQGMTVAGVAFTGLDTAVSGILGKAWFDLSLRSAVIVVGLVALALSIGCKGAVAKLAADPKSKKTRRRLKVVTFVGFVLVLVLAWGFFSTRSPSESIVDFMLTHAGMTLALFTLSLAVLAGSLWAAAHDYLWSRRHDRDFQGVQLGRGKIAGLRNWINKL